jgi:ligand-binding sensor domain-containing protein
MDKAGKLWVGTSKGLLQQSNSTVSYRMKLKSSNIDSVTGGLSAPFHYKENLYLGRLTNKGLVIVDHNKSKEAINFFQNNSSERSQ